MCKNKNNQARAIEAAKAGGKRVFAIFETKDVRDLVGLVRIHNGSTAELCDVHRDGTFTKFDEVPCYSKPNNRKIANWFDLGGLYEVCPC